MPDPKEPRPPMGWALQPPEVACHAIDGLVVSANNGDTICIGSYIEAMYVIQKLMMSDKARVNVTLVHKFSLTNA